MKGMVYAVIGLAIMVWLAYNWLSCASTSPQPPANERQGEHVTIGQLAWHEGMDGQRRPSPAEPSGLWCGTSQWKSIGGWGATIQCHRFGTGYGEGGDPAAGPTAGGTP